MGFVLVNTEATPSITNCSFVMRVSQASHCSPSPGPPQNLGMLLYGRRPSLSLLRMTRRTASASIRGLLDGSRCPARRPDPSTFSRVCDAMHRRIVPSGSDVWSELLRFAVCSELLRLGYLSGRRVSFD